MPASEEEIVLCYACGAPMDVSTVAPYSRVVCPSCSAENRVKKLFGPYTLTRRHAIGGMSSVFIAIDQTLNREVALKILSEEFSRDENRIAAFEEEARLTASFSHPNVVRVLTTGRAFGRLYIAMEFVPGGHFESHIATKGRISEQDILPLAIQIADGLKGAHSAGLIHRDVKPGNILLDAGGNAKLVDFGLALVTKGGTATASEIWATPYYVPPEAIEGGAEDFRSDIYAFGATLYHALAGKPPCDEETMVTSKLREAKKNIIPLAKAAPDLTEETCEVIDRAMAYDPANRFASYDEMILALQTALRSANGEILRDSDGLSRTERRARIRRSKRRKIFALSSVLTLLAILTAFLLNKRTEPAENQRRNIPRAIAVDSDSSNNSSQEIASLYLSARKSMEARNYDRAEKIFSKLLADPAVQEPTRTWSGIQAVATALMDGRAANARSLARAVRTHIDTLGGLSGRRFAAGVTPVLEAIDQWPFLDPETLNLGTFETERAMGNFLAGLKNWEQGAPDRALPFFNSIASDPTIADDGILAWFQATSLEYIADHHLLADSPFENDPTSPRQSRDMIEELNRSLTLLKTKGRARFNIRTRQLDLARLEKSLLENPQPPPDAEKQMLEEAATLASAYRFAEIIDLPSIAPGPTPSQTSLVTLAEAALNFLTDMERALTAAPLTITASLADGTAINGLALTSAGKLVAKTSTSAVRELSWTDFSPETLISIHSELMNNPVTEMERLRRHECAIAFQWLAGDRPAAAEAAQRLCSENATFRTRWAAISAPLPN